MTNRTRSDIESNPHKEILRPCESQVWNHAEDTTYEHTKLPKQHHDKNKVSESATEVKLPKSS